VVTASSPLHGFAPPECRNSTEGAHPSECACLFLFAEAVPAGFLGGASTKVQRCASGKNRNQKTEGSEKAGTFPHSRRQEPQVIAWGDTHRSSADLPTR
jgi:hypothetical protein